MARWDTRKKDYDIRTPGPNADGKYSALLFDTDGILINERDGLYVDAEAARAGMLRWISKQSVVEAPAKAASESAHVVKFRKEIDRLRGLEAAAANLALAKEQEIVELRRQANGFAAAANELQKIIDREDES